MTSCLRLPDITPYVIDDVSVRSRTITCCKEDCGGELKHGASSACTRISTEENRKKPKTLRILIAFDILTKLNNRPLPSNCVSFPNDLTSTMPFTSTPSPFSLTSFTSHIAVKSNDYESRFGRCEHAIAPLSREEARERMESDPAALETTTPLYYSPDPQEREPVSLRRQLTALNNNVVQHLIDDKEVEDKIIALDYRLKLDMCLRDKRC